MASHNERDRFLALVLANRWNAIVLERTAQLGVTDWWLTAGCIAQSVWNGLYGRQPDHGILDYDIFYFDPDTSWAAEDKVIRAAAKIFADLPISVQIRNQARVPLWYEEKFGTPFPPVEAASDGIGQFPCATVAVGVRRDGDSLRIHAPFGLALLLGGELIPNPALPIPDVYGAKTGRWRKVWPELVVAPWPE
ncbi:nucleotidyltransferase family protein [Microvirga terricola]|uniref:nucleotidyltransferase family protein n=1 Tax=Microvirga terricola TaxID=2719797 RepID=UPI00197B3736|nr:nucleotidyltransferase family protein [Microvirga terricola]